MKKIKISRKLSIGISSIMILIATISIVINIFFVEKYYIHEKRKTLDKIEKEISDKNIEEIINNINKIEDENNVTIVYSDINQNLENINEDVLYKFENKKIKLNKFWITQDTLEKLNTNSVNKIYDQGKTKYKVLTKFIKFDKYIFAIGMPLPYLDETISIINKFHIYIMVFSLGLMVTLIILLSRKIIKPLEKLKNLSKDIASLNFRREDIKTNDEIEELTISINSMSSSLEKAHNHINSQNENLKTLISDISHELKTPVALIKVYSQGIEDGLDDGTYIDIIKEQTDNMEDLIEKLLYWAKLEKNILNRKKFDLGKKIINVLKKYKLIIEENTIELILNFNFKEDYEIYADEELMDTVLNNLITNSIKYTNNKKIEIYLFKNNGEIKFKIVNGIENQTKEHIKNIWTPFYVVEKSRNKTLSGTGLGLPIVKNILENHKVNFDFEINNNKIEFYIIFNEYY